MISMHVDLNSLLSIWLINLKNNSMNKPTIAL